MNEELKIGRALARTKKPVLLLEYLNAQKTFVVRREARYKSIRTMIYFAGKHAATAVLIWVGKIAYFYSLPESTLMGWAQAERVSKDGDVLEIARREKRGAVK